MYPITFEKLEDLGDVIGSFMNEFDVPNAPMLALATFKSPGNSADTFLKLDSWTKVSHLFCSILLCLLKVPFESIKRFSFVKRPTFETCKF